MLKGRKILLGITGSIAAYKAALLTRLLVQRGAEVQVVMTPVAMEFITPLTLSTLSKRPVLSKTHNPETGEWTNHVDIALWADAMVIAPASANTMAKMASGQCDNLLLTIYLSARSPVFFAPAMDLDMLNHPATTHNIQQLVKHGLHQIKPGFGELASGLTGQGRMAEPEEIVQTLENFFQTSMPLAGKTALVTAGPTYEAIDPVRFIGNYSSGKMGFAIAEELSRQGAQVNLVTGPTHEKSDTPGITIHSVTSAEDMHQKCLQLFPASDITVLSAAVADYRPKEKAAQKIKKTEADLTLELVKTPDIAASLGKLKHNGQIIAGFALETENEKANAEKKLAAKNFDFIVLNSLQDAGAGFGHETNKIEIIRKDKTSQVFPLKEKKEVARDIVAALIHFHA